MARNQSITSEGLDVFTDFDRMLESLQHVLITPDAATETKLRTSRLERQKVATVCLMLPLLLQLLMKMYRISSTHGKSSLS